MGQKVNPHGLRVGVIKDWDSRWFAKDNAFGDILVEDYKIRKFLKKTLYAAGVPKIEIERDAEKVRVHIHCAKPGIVIGKGGAEIEKLRMTVQNMIGKPVVLNIVEVRQPDLNAQLVAENIAAQLVDKLSPAAEIIGACNVFVNDDGVITGHITDGVGFVKNLELNGVPVKDKKVVVLGAGGAATAIQVQLALDGAKEVNIFNIKDKFFERAEGTKAKLAEKCPECVVTVDDLDDKAKLEEAIKACDILVNATIMGMKPHQDVTLVDKSLFRKDLVVADTVYSPEKTKMILEAEEAGCKAIGGVGMLQQQGAVNYGLFVGKEMPLAEYQEFQKAQAK